MKVEFVVDGKVICETHVPKSIDITYKIRNGKIIKVVKSIAEDP